MSRTADSLSGSNNHLSAAVLHVAANIVDVRTCNLLATSANNVVCRVYAVAASAVSAKQIVISVAVDKVGSLAVYGNVEFLVAFYALAGLRVEFDKAYVSEVCAV